MYRHIRAEAESASTVRDAQLEAAHDCWYRGFVAEEFVRFQQREWRDSSGERHAGLLAEDDLRGWAPTWEEPLSVNYHGYEVFKAGPWRQAPVFLQQLRLLEGFDLGAMRQARAERRLALGRAGDSVSRLLPRHARPDVLARGRPAELARSRQAPADDALAHVRDPGRGAVSRPRHARRRPAGPVDAAHVPRPRPP